MIDRTMKQQPGWRFDNSYAQLPEAFYARQEPAPVHEPELVMLNESLAASLGLDAEALRGEDTVAAFAGNQVPEGAAPLAQAYGGHQFGHFNMLGDGRALLLGEHITPSGQRFDIQLKGSGRTPYSRGGDGRAALGPMLREYIISEAMFALGIPTTRSLAVVTTGEPVYRETELPGAVLTRVAASHIRVGTFQYAAQWRTTDELRALADYTLERHYSEAAAASDSIGENRYLTLIREVMKRQAALIAQWQLVGFIHGVMNTDNMAISGETIDYGPCAFMDAFDPATVFSSIDRQGRYAYGNQPQIGAWNLARFAETLLPLLHDDMEQAVELAQEALSSFAEQYYANWLTGMKAKLGLFPNVEADADADEDKDKDEELIKQLLGLMQQHHADYTNTFRMLTLGDYEAAWSAHGGSEEFALWHSRWRARLDKQQESADAAQDLMRRSNPAVIPRNHRVEEALAAAVERSDYSVMNRLLASLSNPYAYTADQEAYCALPAPSGLPYRTFCGT